MQSLHQLVVSGKVLYLGVSDTPAWVVSKANQYARDHGLTQFWYYIDGFCFIYFHSLVFIKESGQFFQEILKEKSFPCARVKIWALLLGVTNIASAYSFDAGALGRGRFKTDEQLKRIKETGENYKKIYHGRN